MAEPLMILTEREGVILRELTTDNDDSVYYEAYNASRLDIEAFEPESVDKHKTIEDTRNTRLKSGDKIRMGIWDGDTFVGSVNATPDEKGVEIGYWTDSRYTGKGYATLGARALGSYAAKQHAYIHAEVVEGNDASVRVLRKSGFRKTASEAGKILFEYNPMTINEASYHDIELLTDFMQPVYATTYPNNRGIKREMFENGIFHEHLHDYLEAKLSDPKVNLIVARDREASIKGTIGIERGSEDLSIGEVWGFYVDQSLQAQGIGTELWEYLMASDLVKPFNLLALTVAKDSRVATEFYKKQGFNIIGEEDWHWPSWTEEHLLNQYWLMQKSITH